MKYKYKFSVIIPIYNVEEYLEETIESVINQSIGFQDNIELILVNDGSTDNSESICLKYLEQYPNNIKYINKENGGVSSARNKGLEYIEGKYVNFLDSDDKWDNDAFKKAYDMFENNEEIDAISVRIKFFDANNKYHNLDYKFKKDIVVDLNEQYEYIHVSSSAGFIRSSSINHLRFDCNLKYSEDIKFITEIIINTMKLGIISSSLYYYRRRFNLTSAIQKKDNDISWYLDVPIYCYKYLMDLSIKKFGIVIPYIQYIIMHDYQWRIKDYNPNFLDSNDYNKYLIISKQILEKIDDKVIIEQKNLFNEYKVQTLNFKYGYDISSKVIYKNNQILFNEIPLYNINNTRFIIINNINNNSNKLIIDGQINLPFNKELYKIKCYAGNQELKMTTYSIPLKSRKFFNDEFMKNIGFTIKIPDNIKDIYFILKFSNNVILLPINFTTNSGLSDLNYLYAIKGNKILKYKNNHILINNKKCNILNELKVYYNLIYTKKVFGLKISLIRLLANIYGIFNNKEIWLISDRPNIANDNGMHFFKYVNSLKNNNIKSFFCINENNDSYLEMKKYGKVLNLNSLKYKIIFLNAEKVISSQADTWVLNPFGKAEIYYRGIFKYKFVFLQHGITKDDISSWVHKLNKNIYKFVTAATNEYNSIVNGTYGYTKNEIILTGFPRFDNLYNEEEKIIAIMPTWRQNIAGNYNHHTGLRDYNPDFIYTDYFKFYNDLITDEKLLTFLNKNNYKLCFVIHPSFEKQAVDFKSNNNIEILSGNVDYQTIFRKAKLLITDYSSVAFDFGYLRKPILYTQFDKDNFFSGHLYDKGYFSYEKDGFGPIVTNKDDTIKYIIDMHKNNFKLDKTYQKRINNFFKFNDQNNSYRVYQELIKK